MLTGITKESVLISNVLAFIGIVATHFISNFSIWWHQSIYIWAGVMCLVAALCNFAIAWDLYWKSKGHTE